MILSLRGTSGSGKSTAVRAILDMGPTAVVEEVKRVRGARPLVYRVDAEVPLFVFGSYATVCGGVDTIQDYKTVVPQLLDRYAPRGHVLFEGLLLSGTYGSTGAKMAELAVRGHEAVCVFLDTPLEVCLQRVQARRAARGDDRPLNPKNTTSKHNQIVGALRRLQEHGLRVVTIDHRRAAEQLLELLAGAQPLPS